MRQAIIRTKSSFLVSLLLIFMLSFSLSQLLATQKTYAAYDGGRIIDNGVFLNAKSMSASDIQGFLASKSSGLKNMQFTLSCYGSDSKERQLYTAAGATCDTPIPASHIIYYAAQIYGVNPKVILATMQKEQSLTTAPNPTSWQLNQAMGYACPTSGACGGNSTFPYQIDSGTWALRYHFERARGNMTWWSTSSSWTCGTEKNLYKPSLYPGQNVRFYDTNGTHYATIFIQNAATSSMYCYTPHAYNNPQGLYGRTPYGTTGLYYSGSYNFVYFYELWFGSTQVDNCVYPDQAEGSIFRLYDISSNTHFLTTDPMEVCYATGSGWMFDGAIFREGSSGHRKPVFRLHHNGDYIFTDSEIERDVAVNTYGYQLQGVAFYGANNQTDPSNARPVYRLQDKRGGYLYTSSDQERDLLIREGNRYEKITFYVRETLGTAIAPTYRLAHPNGSYLYTLSSAERDSAVADYGYRAEGVGFNVITGLNQITVPIYRLAGSGGYLFTTSLDERISAVRTYGYRNEGIGMYTYGAMNDPALKNIHRLARVGSYFYTTSEEERDIAASLHSFRKEGVGFQTP